MSSSNSSAPPSPPSNNNSPPPPTAAPPSPEKSSSPPTANSSSPAPSGSSPPPAPSKPHGAPLSPGGSHARPAQSSRGTGDDSSSGSSQAYVRRVSAAEIIFAAAGAAALLALLIAACVCCSRRTAPRRRRKPRNPMHLYADTTASGHRGNSTYRTSGPQPQWQSDTGAGPSTSTLSGSPGSSWHAPPDVNSSPRDRPPIPQEGPVGFDKGTFTYADLAAATKDFSQANLLGQGGFGYVHKGVLPNGRAVAVKQLKSGGGQGEREFQAEVDIISRVHHRHLVSLVGHCVAGASRMLVYEFVPNKTLEFHLHALSSACRERVAADGMGDEAARRARVGEGARLPARGLPASDHPPRHQIRQHPPGRQLRGHGRGLRASQADVRRQHARVDPRHGDVRVPGAGVRVEREADGEVGRVLLRRGAAGAPDGAAADRRHHPVVPGRRARRLGEAGPVPRAGRRRLRRRGRPEAGGQLRPGGDGARGRQLRGLRPTVGQEAPQDEPDSEGAGGGHVARGPERGGAAGAECAVRRGRVVRVEEGDFGGTILSEWPWQPGAYTERWPVGKAGRRRLAARHTSPTR